MGTFNGKMYETDESIYKDIFAGIKVYPQLGFDPFPDTEEEFEKVDFLYQYCISKRIPIMSHCSDGGFKVGNFNTYTSPTGKWAKVLERYPNLTLCFAHFGNQSNGCTDWQKAIIAHTAKPNVYTDISCNNATQAYYNQLGKLVQTNQMLQHKLLFGSDFSINMFASKVNSYNQYLKAYIESAHLGFKPELQEYNPEAYLFGKS
jgi:predicted TIM-barrel fold metal-dependent hydrolase